MKAQRNFHRAEMQILSMQTEGGAEMAILRHWRAHDPKKVEALMAQGILRKTLKLQAQTLFELQIVLEETENLNPVSAQSEAWNRLMQTGEEETESLEMALKDYRDRP